MTTSAYTISILRDRALMLVGFTGALRRSELAAITVADLEHTERGLRLTLSQTKGSQDTAVTVPLPYGETAFCPVRALERWLAAATIADGPVFRRIWTPPQRGDGPPPPPRRRGAHTTVRCVHRPGSGCRRGLQAT